MSKRDEILDIIKNYGFDEIELDSYIRDINLVFEYFDDEEYCAKIFSKVFEYASISNDGRAKIVKTIDACKKLVYKQEYVRNIMPLNLSGVYSGFQLNGMIEDYTQSIIEASKNAKVPIIDLVSENTNKIGYGIITYEGLFFPLSRESGFSSHDELIRYLKDNYKTSSEHFLQVGLKLGRSINNFPLIRVQTMDDSSVPEVDKKVTFEFSNEISRALYNVYQSCATNDDLFEKFMLENLLYFGINEGEETDHYRRNLGILKCELDRNFDPSFLEYLYESGRYKGTIVPIAPVSGEDE